MSADPDYTTTNYTIDGLLSYWQYQVSVFPQTPVGPALNTTQTQTTVATGQLGGVERGVVIAGMVGVGVERGEDGVLLLQVWWGWGLGWRGVKMECCYCRHGGGGGGGGRHGGGWWWGWGGVKMECCYCRHGGGGRGMEWRGVKMKCCYCRQCCYCRGGGGGGEE